MKKKKKFDLADLFYCLGFDNAVQAEIENYVKGEYERPKPELPKLRRWAERTAKKFKCKN